MLNKNNRIIKTDGMNSTDQLLEAYDSVGKARQYCLEALDEQDLNANPT